jgi:cephalosporin-C deacetylase
MPQPYDWPLEKLKEYQPALTREADFETFWAQTKQELSETRLEYQLKPYDYPVKNAKVYNIIYKGFHDADIEGWLVIPAGAGPHPGLVLFHGYNWAYDGKLHDTVNMALHGYACLQILVRGQQGRSVDNIIVSTGHPMGWLTKGILNPYEYYYRAVYMDALRAVEVLASLETVDEKRIGLMGGSQGAALTIVTAAMSDIPRIAIADSPFLAHFERAIDIAPGGPYNELNEFFRRYSDPQIEVQAKRTLSYFDVMNHAPNVKCFTQMAMGLIDQTTPPSTMISVYNHLKCPKDITIWRYFGHEAIPGTMELKLKMLMESLAS